MKSDSEEAEDGVEEEARIRRYAPDHDEVVRLDERRPRRKILRCTSRRTWKVRLPRRSSAGWSSTRRMQLSPSRLKVGRTTAKG